MAVPLGFAFQGVASKRFWWMGVCSERVETIPKVWRGANSPGGRTFHCGQKFGHQSGKLPSSKKRPPEKQNATFHIWGSLTALRFPLPNLPTIPNFWYSGSFSKVIVQALTIDHPLTRVFVLMCMLHPDKPSNLSGPWVTNVANMITGIYVTITRIYAAITRIYAVHFFRQISQISRNTNETQEHNLNFCVECLSISFREL